MTPNPRLPNPHPQSGDERARLLEGIPWDPDPLDVQPDELVERRSLYDDYRRVVRLGHSTGRLISAVLLAALIAGLSGCWAGRATATSRPSSGAAVFRMVTLSSTSSSPEPLRDHGSPSGGTAEVGDLAGRPSLILDPAAPTEPATPPGDVAPDGELVVSDSQKHSDSASISNRLSGLASYYDWHPGEAAACAPFRAALPDWRGRTVWVSGIAVRVTDFCPQTGRVIDLDAGTFARLAPLSQGLVSVTVSWQ